MEVAPSFSSPSVVITPRKPSQPPRFARTLEHISDQYSIAECVRFIVAHRARRVALQFPDSLLGDASVVSGLLEEEGARLLSSKTDSEVEPRAKLINEYSSFLTFTLADTSYGSCCVDQVAAQHVTAEVILHYGHACLSRTKGIPVHYIFAKLKLDVEALLVKLAEWSSGSANSSVKNLVLLYSQGYQSFFSDAKVRANIADRFQQSCSHLDGCPGLHIAAINVNCSSESSSLESSTLLSSSSEVGDGWILKSLSRANLAEEGTKFVFVGGLEDPTLLHLCLNNPLKTIFRYDPSASEQGILQDSPAVNRTLSRRFYLTEKAKNANIIGIVMGTLHIDRHLELIEVMKKMIAESGKKSYLFVVGKINEPKLGNFPEVDIFVVNISNLAFLSRLAIPQLVACSHTCLVDSRSHFRDIVTPFELKLALSGDDWKGEYSTNFADILPGGEFAYTPEVDDAKPESDAPRYSTVDGALHESTRTVLSKSRELARPNTELQTATAQHYMLSRTFKGLEMGIAGEREKPAEVTMGLDGIAKGYTTVNSTKDESKSDASPT